MTDDDIDLLRRWQSGEREAGSALLRRHFGTVYRFFVTKVDTAAADDLMQKTFLACHEAHERIRPELGLRAFLLGIARKKLLMHFRTEGRLGRRFRPEHDSVAAMTESPSGLAARREEHRLLLHALRTLPLDLQIVLELHYWEDMRVVQIAAVLEIPEGTVKTRLGRARERLRAAVEQLPGPAAVRVSTLQDLEGWARQLAGSLPDPPSS